MLQYNQRFISPFPPEEAARRLSGGLKGRGLLGIRMRMEVGFYGKATPDSVTVFRVAYMVLGMMASCFYGRFSPDPEGSVLEGRFGLHWKAWFIPGVIASAFLLAISLGDPFGMLDYFWGLIGILAGNLGVWYLVYATELLPGRRKIAAFIEERIGGAMLVGGAMPVGGAVPVGDPAAKPAGNEAATGEGMKNPAITETMLTETAGAKAPMSAPSVDILAELKRALEIEAEGVSGLIGRLDAGFEAAVRMLFECRGKVVVTGMGKSGHVANKIAATLASTGTRSFFLHPAEAIHGDLGMLEPKDVVLAISNSGATGEVLRLLGPFKRIGVKLLAMTGDAESELARRADLHLDVSVPREACPLNLTPTASTTAALALGDAIAVTLLSLRNFRPEDYAVFHPGGDLGKKLMTTVGDLMESAGKAPVVDGAVTVAEAVREIQDKGYGLTAVTGAEGRLAGSFSLGDLMRLHISHPDLAFMSEPVEGFMTENPRAITADTLAAQALNTMETHSIRALFVADAERRPVGIIGIYEVLKAIDY